MKQNKFPNWAKVTLVLIGLALLMLNPFVRAIVLFLLPLGSGIDDFIVIALLVIAGVVTWLGGWQWLFDRLRSRK